MELRRIRKAYNLTQEEAAKILGITRRTYANYEAGKIDENSVKYSFILETLKKSNLIDEEHGVLSLDSIKTICSDIFKKYPIDYCYLFGSYAKGMANEKSDIDLLVSMPIDGMIYFELIETLREKLHKKVDLLDVNQLKNNYALVQEILKDGIKIYGKQ